MSKICHHFQNAEDGDISKVGLDTFDTFPLATLETVFCKERICKMSQEDAFTIFKNWMAYDFKARKDKWLDLVDLINLIGGSKRKRAVIGYDFTTNEVNLFSDMTIDMFDHAAENIEQTIFIFGGPNELRNLDNIFTFDTSTFQFKRSALKLNKSRHSFGSCAFDKNIYIMGERYDGSVSNVVEIYDPREGICHSLEKMLCGRQRSAYTKLNNQIYAFGGWYCIGRNEATVYEIRNDSWLKLAPLKTSLCLIKATEFRNKLYLFGGVVPNDSRSKDVNIYTPATGNWTMSTKKLPYYMDSYAMATH
uniref:BACK domain-containing protein n=2 Tax=Rhabditophanes sp. KR3021 TaxID=114890 RepID=A0AC35TFY6_9BILA